MFGATSRALYLSPRSFFLAVVWAIFLLCGSGAAQTPQQQSARSRPPVASIVSAATGLSIEYRADLTIRWFESLPAADRIANQQLIKDLYHQLDYAHNQLPTEYAPAADGESVERELVFASYVVKLDALSLRIGIIRAMYPASPSWSVRQLKELRFDIPRIDCSNPAVPDVSSYYQAVGDLLFPGSSAQHSSNFLWLEDRIRRIESPLEIVPISELVRRVKFSENQRNELIAQLAMALRQLAATDRELDRGPEANSEKSIPSALAALLKVSPNNRVMSSQLLASYREFLQASASQSGCSDRTSDWNSLVDGFNKLIAQVEVQDSVSPLHVPHREFNGGKAVYHFFPNQQQTIEIMRKMYRLRAGHTTFMEMFSSNESLWKSYSNEILSIAESYDDTATICSECSEYSKIKLFVEAFDVLPPGTMKDHMLQTAVNALSNSDLQTSNPELWAFQLYLLLNMARQPKAADKRQIDVMKVSEQYLPFGPIEMSEIRQYMRQANQLVRAYAMADDILQPPFKASYLTD